MSWGEAIRLSGLLASDPSSQVAAALLEWPNPLSREALLLLDTFDLHGQVAVGKKHVPHPMRPKQRRAKKQRKEQVLTQDEILEVLRKAGHTLQPPTP